MAFLNSCSIITFFTVRFIFVYFLQTPPLLPKKPMEVIFFDFVDLRTSKIFLEFPLVDNTTKISFFFFPIPSSALENIFSYLKSLAHAVNVEESSAKLIAG